MVASDDAKTTGGAACDSSSIALRGHPKQPKPDCLKLTFNPLADCASFALGLFPDISRYTAYCFVQTGPLLLAERLLPSSLDFLCTTRPSRETST